MEDFLREYYGLATKAVEVIAVLAALVVYKKYKHTPVKYFLWFLFYVFCVELIGGYTLYVESYEFLAGFKKALKGTLFEKNNWWFNIAWSVVSVLFYSFYFRTIIVQRSYKIVIKWATALFFIGSIINILSNVQLFFTSSLTFIRISGSIVILICTTLYFLDVLKGEKLLTFYRSVNFYIASVIFIWFLVITPLDFYDVYFYVDDWDYIILKGVIKLTMNIFMYLTFAFALLWCKPQNN